MRLFRGNGLRWLGIGLLFFIPLISLYVLEKQVIPTRNAFQSVPSDFQYADRDRVWRSYDPAQHLEKVTGSYTFKLNLPENRWRDPYLYMLFVPNAEVYLDDRLIYSFAPRFEYWEHPHLIKLPDDFGGQTLMIHVDFHNQLMYPGMIAIDAPLNLLARVFIQSGYRIILGFVTLLISIGGFVLYFKRRQVSDLYFSLFALYITQLCVARSWFLFGVFASSPTFPYFQNVLLALGAYCFLRFYETVFGVGPYRMLRRLAQGMLAVFALLLVTAFTVPTLHMDEISKVVQNGISPAVMAIVLASAVHTYWKRRDVESFWFMAGFVTVGVSTLIYFLQPLILWINRFESGGVLYSTINKILYSGDRFLHGIFILLFCMVMIMGERIRKVYHEAQTTAEELAQLSGSLEQLVQERTKELEQMNLNLRSSMQETAEALAEVAVLEDRNRIAQDMHDRTGHSLTAALIQIEAVKMLATKDSELALKKIEATRESVASALESIRETVRMMKLDYEERALVPSIQKLIQETQSATGIQIIYDPVPLPDLNTILKKTVYLALQEGLTNGIRHGKATRFEFSLKMVEDTLYFQLANNGAPYASQEFGFGLNTMRERIERLNGTIQLESTPIHACVLRIEIPVEPEEEQRSEHDDPNPYSG